LGINKNFLNSISHISTSKFKILASDDLYYRNNIFNINNSNDLTFSPVIKYDGVEAIGSLSINSLIIANSNFYFRLLLKLKNIFNAPGSFFKIEFFHDKKLIEYVNAYTFLEDYPLWYYLFNKYKNLKVRIDSNPYIIYRVNSGVSNNKSNISKLFRDDELRFKRTNSIPTNRFQRFLNPIFYLKILIELTLIFPFRFFIRRIQLSDSIIKSEIITSQHYINLIKVNSAIYKESI
jgi:hypothetical protein